jgi:hypothetical protein
MVGIVDRRRALIAALSVVAAGGMAGCRRRRVTPAPAQPSPRPLEPLNPSAAAQLFQPGSRHRLDTGVTATAEVVSAGSLQLPTGRLVAVDPSWLYLTRPPVVGPFTVAVPPGTYPLELALLRWNDLRVAAARLTVTDRPVTAWEMALRPVQVPGTLQPGYFFGVGVDVATIVVFDATAFAEMDRLADTDPAAFTAWDPDRPVHRAEIVPGANAIAFATGWGDGSYPVWIGRTDDGTVSCFLFDMLMLATTTPSATPWPPPQPTTHPGG